MFAESVEAPLVPVAVTICTFAIGAAAAEVAVSAVPADGTFPSVARLMFAPG
jgi:hypothetical protein